MDIVALRQKIDNIDEKIVSLLEERFEISKLIGEYKKENGIEILDSEREKELMAHISSALKDENLTSYIENIYNTILAESKRRQTGN